MTAELHPRDSPGRRRSLRIGSVVVAGALLIAAGAFFWQRGRKAPPPPPPPSFDLSAHDPQIAAIIERARGAVVQSPASGAAWGTLGAALMANKLHREAMPCLETAERLQPHEARWPYLQGIILLTWDAGAAVSKLQRAAELAAPNLAAPRLRLAHLLLERGRAEEAQPLLHAVAATHPEDPHLLLGLGKLELANRRLEEALQHLERSASQSATARASHALIALIQQRLGNTDAAQRASALAESLPRDPPMPDPFVQETAVFISGLEQWLTQADRLLKAGQLKEAIALNERTIATYPQSATAWQRLGLARIEEKNPEAAMAAFRKALELSPRSSETHFQLGTVLFEQGNFAAAEESFRRTLEIRPGYAAAHYNLGLCLLQRADLPGAIDAFQKAIRYEPRMAAAHKQLGAALALEMRFPEAVESLRRAAELDPKDAVTAQMLKRAELRLHEKQEQKPEIP